MEQIIDQYHFRITPIFEFLNIEYLKIAIEIDGSLYSTQHWHGEIFQNFILCCNCSKANISDNILHKINFFLFAYVFKF